MKFFRCAGLVTLVFITRLNLAITQVMPLDSILDFSWKQLTELEEVTNSQDSLSRIKYALAKKNLKIDLQKSIALFDEALHYSAGLDDDPFRIQIMKSKALAFINLQEVEKAKTLLNEVAEYYDESGEKEKYGSTIGFYSYMYSETNEYAKALEYAFKALEIFEELNHEKETQNLVNRIGIIYGKMGEYEKALEYYEQNINALKSTKEGLYRASINNAGGLYLKLGKLDKAEKYLKESFELRKLENNPKTLAYAYDNLADIEIIRKNNEQALLYIDTAYSLFYEVDFRNGAASMLIKKTILLKDMDKPSLYKKSVVETYNQLQQWDIKNDEEVILSAYADILFEEGKTNEAYANLRKSFQLFKDKYSENKFAEIEKLENQLRKEKEESRFQELSRQIEVRNIQRNYLLTVLGLGSALILLLLYSNRDRKKKNSAISKSLGEKEVLIKEIHHRVKNNLQIVSSILSLQSRNITDKDTKEAILDSRDRVKSMALIHQKLYQENNLKGVEMKSYLENLVSSLSHSYNFTEQDIKFTFEVDPLILDIDSTIPIGLITNELITNSLKYAFEEGEQGMIHVKLVEDGKFLILEVKDNGRTIQEQAEIQEGFGFQLVRSLGRKLKSMPEFSFSNGLSVSLKIKNFKKVAS